MDRLLKFERKNELASKWSYRRVARRAPRKGEYYVSGAIPEAYRAPNDLSDEFLIVEPLVEHKLKQVWLPA